MKNDNISQMSKEVTEKYQKLLSELSNVFDVDLDQADPIEKMRIEYIKDALIGSLIRIKTAQNNNSVSIDHSYVLEFALEENGSYSVIGINHCQSENIIVPNIYMGKPVRNIADYAFSDCRGIKK